ncbi:hypothetical protein Tco_1120420 [Tanacetum coccineum]
MIEEPVKKLSKKDQLKLGEEIALKLQADIDEDERIVNAEEQKIDEANITWDDIQVKVNADYQLAERLQAEEQEQFTIKEKARLFKELIEKRRKHFAAKRAEEKRNKPPTKTQQKKTMITYLKNMEGWKHKDLKSKDFDSIKELFDKALKKVNMFMDFRTKLVDGSSKRAGTELEQEVTKKQKVDDVQETIEVDSDQEAAKIKELMEIVPDEEEVAIDAIPLADKADGKSQMYRVLSQMLKSFDMQDLEGLYKLVKAKYESTRTMEDLDLVLWNDLKLSMKKLDDFGDIYQVLRRIVGIISSLMMFGVTTALIDVNAAQSKLVLLENFNENYSKCLRLLVEVTTPSTKLLLLKEVTTTRGSYYC